MAPVAAATSARSSGATKSASARPPPQSIESSGPAMKPSRDMHLFTTTLPLMSTSAIHRSRRAARCSDLRADRRAGEVPRQQASHESGHGAGCQPGLLVEEQVACTGYDERLQVELGPASLVELGDREEHVVLADDDPHVAALPAEEVGIGKG